MFIMAARRETASFCSAAKSPPASSSVAEPICRSCFASIRSTVNCTDCPARWILPLTTMVAPSSRNAAAGSDTFWLRTTLAGTTHNACWDWSRLESLPVSESIRPSASAAFAGSLPTLSMGRTAICFSLPAYQGAATFSRSAGEKNNAAAATSKRLSAPMAPESHRRRRSALRSDTGAGGPAQRGVEACAKYCSSSRASTGRVAVGGSVAATIAKNFSSAGVTLRRLLGKRPQNDGLQQRNYRVDRRRRLIQDREGHRAGVGAQKRMAAGEHLHQNHAQGPDVGALIDGFAQDLFGRHVRQRSRGGDAVRGAGGGGQAREAEVYNFDHLVLRDH